MKTHLILSSLLILAGYAAIELAKSAGVSLPDALNVGNAVIAFTVVSLALVVLADYGPKVRPIPVVFRTRRIAVPCRRSVAVAHHHLYAIRRGAEAARLAAAPARVAVYPKNNVASWKRAA